MARSSGLNDLTAVDTDLVGLSGVHTITVMDKVTGAFLFPMQILQFSLQGHKKRRGQVASTGEGSQGLGKYLVSKGLAWYQVQIH